eukprot:CAMPEP_0203847336 /NCGR_PEP_ID=MMETSP0359-20131031/4954_1 /ASSEMBLY_ACC=CAM_ASM_000338 /TAXON_ID=268821 /ORGANISM="Scrippsiella Hangoei, Strain SHTV-5" /LENGTH=721 /DNA_ID=CAMNT_0050762783 /DNA_START=78 /DNA_END=2243 /DNA_ORIENTATION=-
MARFLAIVLQCLLVISTADKGVLAVQKVIQMLGNMQAKVKEEQNADEVAFAEFKTWCEMESAELKKEIGENGKEIERLSASIGKLASEIKTLGEEIGTLQEELASNEADKTKETEQREKDRAAFLEEEKDYSESVDALDRAIAIMSKENYDRPAASASLLQVSQSSRMPEKAKSIIAAFIGMEDPLGGMDYQAPEANGYEYQSGGIIEMLKKLQDDFRGKLGETQKEEMNSQHAFNMIVMDLTDSVENKNRAIEEKTAEKASKTEQKAADEKSLQATIDLKASNEKTFKEMSSECEEKNMSYQEKQQLRKEEIEAIGKAMEIMQSPEVMGSTEKHLSLAQVGASRSLVQLRGGESLGTQGVHRRIREFLEHEGQRLHSKSLTLLSEKMAADPFVKVKKMIDTMITRLLEEANQDAQHEGFCDTEMGKNKITRTKLSEDIDALSASIDEGKATILKLSEEIATLTKEVEELDKFMGEATSMRNAEKAKNKETVDDSKAGQTAVAAATAVLKDFYEKASTATGFIQLSKTQNDPRAFGLKTGVKMGTDEWDSLANPNFKGSVETGTEVHVDTGHKEGMQTFGEKETGKQDEANFGVLALMEIIQSDFANLQSDTESAEAAAAEAYERFMVEANKNKAMKLKKTDMDEADKTAAEAKLQTDTADLKATQDELLAADRYYEKLVPQCIDQGQTFEERTGARKAEIDSLKEALKLLESPDIATSSL